MSATIDKALATMTEVRDLVAAELARRDAELHKQMQAYDALRTERSRLIDFAHATLSILGDGEEWNSDTLESIAQEGVRMDLLYADRDGTYAKAKDLFQPPKAELQAIGDARARELLRITLHACNVRPRFPLYSNATGGRHSIEGPANSYELASAIEKHLGMVCTPRSSSEPL